MPGKTLEERVEAAIVARFFEPTWVHSSQPTMQGDGSVSHQIVPMQVPAEMTMVAQAIYNQARDEIVRKVLEQLDIDALVAQWADVIAKDVVKQLQAMPDNNWRANPSTSNRQKMMDKVYEDVAAEFGRQAVEHIKNTGGLMGILEA